MTTFNLDELNQKFESTSPQDIFAWAVKTYSPSIVLTSSFGGDSAAMLHMATQIDPRIRIVFLNTGFLFKETLSFVAELKQKMNLNLQEYTATPEEIELVRKRLNSPDNKKGECCDAVKVRLMQDSLRGVQCWVAGLQRSEAKSRKNIKIIESYGEGMVKVHPIANWTSKDVYNYMKKFDLPFHPLWSKGYKSLGCEPCTSLPLSDQDDRSGRWAGTEKTECGIHTFLKDQK